jgi:phage terminase large subunit GpA-like protein
VAIASSAAELRSKTIRKLFRDEIDQYPANLGDQGDPLAISDGRITSFLALGTWKKADVSTPTILGESAIQDRFLAGDQRFLFVRCPGCASPFRFEFGPNFRYERTFPHQAFYAAPCCGQVIDAAQKNGLVREACRLKEEGLAFGWQPTAPRPGAFPSYHFDTLSSPFVPWDVIAAKRSPPRATRNWRRRFAISGAACPTR